MSLQFRILVVVIGAALIFFGITQLRDMPVGVFPEFAPPYVEIQTEALGLSAYEVESLITLPLEELLIRTPWLKTMRSRSVTGLSSILIIFESGTDIMVARQLVQERITSARKLPNVSKAPVMLQPLSATSRAMLIGLSSNGLSPIEMSVLTRWTIKPRLMSVPGVANVVLWGQRKRQLQVQVDPEKLRIHSVSLDQVIESTGNALWVSPLTYLYSSYPGSGGWIDTPNQRLAIRHVLPISTPDELAQVAIFGAPGLSLGDVAEVVEGHPPFIGDAIIGDGAGLILVVEKFPGANTLEVTQGVEAALEELQPGLPGIEIDSQIYRTATFIEMSIDNLTMGLFIGCGLVILFLFAFLYQWRIALISFIAIMLSLITAGFVLYLSGATMNTMIFAGLVLALGAVVDNAIIDIENIVRRLRQHLKKGSNKSTMNIILEASLEMRSAVAYAMLINILVLVPIFLIGGVSGSFFQPLALTYALTLLVSMATALTVTPALGLILLRSAPFRTAGSPLVRWLQNGYDIVFSLIFRAPRTAFIIAVTIVLVGLAVLPWLGYEMLPSFKERHLMINWVGPPSISHPEMYRIMSRVSRELGSIPGVRNVGAHVGRGVTGDQVVGINSSHLWISLNTTADYDATMAAIEEVVNGYPGHNGNVQTYLKESIREVLEGGSEAIGVRLFGPEPDLLRLMSEDVRQVLAKIDGIVDSHVELQVVEPHVEIEVDLASVAPYGLTPGDIRRSAATIFAGIEVGSLFEQQKVFDVVVWSVPETRQSLSDIHEFLLETPGHNRVRLEDVADVHIVPIPTVIKREAFSPYIDVVANVGGRDIGSVVADVERRIREVEFPLEYHMGLLVESADRQFTWQGILGIAVAVAIGIFLLLQACFRNWRLAFLAFVTLPMALAGGVLAVFVDGGIISLGSLVGFLTVFGIVTRNCIMLINHYQHLEQNEGETFGPELVQRGTRERLAPILLTAAITGVALLPFVLFGDIAGLEIVHPMAVVILGGLVTATLINLFVVPGMYLRFMTNPQPVDEGEVELFA